MFMKRCSGSGGGRSFSAPGFCLRRHVQEGTELRLCTLFATLLPRDLRADIRLKPIQLRGLRLQLSELILHHCDAVSERKVAPAPRVPQIANLTQGEAELLADADHVGRIYIVLGEHQIGVTTALLGLPWLKQAHPDVVPHRLTREASSSGKFGDKHSSVDHVAHYTVISQGNPNHIGLQMTKVERAGEFLIGGELRVRRFGFGAMRLTGKGVWGPPEDVPAAQAVLRRVIELGINFIDTAGSYGPGDNERLIRDTLRPYPAGLVIGTKGGMRKSGPSTPENWGIELDASEPFLRKGVEGSLRDLGVERIDLYQLHRIDPQIPVEETMGVLSRLRDEGKIRHVGLSAVSVEQIERARTVIDIATVQNEYNLARRKHEDVLTFCERHNRIHPILSAANRQARRSGGLAVDRRMQKHDTRLGFACVAVAPVASDDRHSRHVVAQASRRECRRCRRRVAFR